MIINFNPKTIVIKPAVAEITAQISELTLIQISDLPSERKVVALIEFNNTQKVFTLWEDDAYDAIGDWTQEQANNKIIELL